MKYFSIKFFKNVIPIGLLLFIITGCTYLQEFTIANQAKKGIEIFKGIENDRSFTFASTGNNPQIDTSSTFTLGHILRYTNTLSVEDVLIQFPLVRGNYWVYSVTSYFDTDFSTSIYTDTVISTSIANESGRYIAYLGDRDLNTIDDSATPQSSIHWSYGYEIENNFIYHFEPFGDDQIAKQLHYVFPLHTKSCWVVNNPLNTPCNGSVFRGPEEYHSTLGVLKNCYYIVLHVALSGSLRYWFCEGIGVVVHEYHHIGTPWGWRHELIEFGHHQNFDES